MHRCLVLSLLASLLPAQLFVVDPMGGGTHTDLQAAILAAPSGAVIQVNGGTYGPLVITRSVTIVGQSLPTIRAPLTGSGSQPPAIRVSGSGTQSVTLARLNISGLCNGSTWNEAGPGIAASGIRRLAIHDCTLHAHEWTATTGNARSASACVITGAGTVQIARSSVRASTSDTGGNYGWAPAGAPAIDASGATVVLLDSTVRGGNAGTSRFVLGPPSPTPCPCGTAGQEPGRGGPGVQAAVAYVAGGAITGGTGSAVLLVPPPVPAITPWGNQPSGVPMIANAVTTLAATLTLTAPLRLGAVHSLGFPPTTNPSLLVIGSPAISPSSVAGVQHVFIDLAQPIASLGLPLAATSYSLPVPAVGLLGYELAEQRFDLSPGGSLLATNPIFGVVTL